MTALSCSSGYLTVGNLFVDDFSLRSAWSGRTVLLLASLSGIKRSSTLSSKHYGKYAKRETTHKCCRFSPSPWCGIQCGGAHAKSPIATSLHGKSYVVGVAKDTYKHRDKKTRQVSQSTHEPARCKSSTAAALGRIDNTEVISYARDKRNRHGEHRNSRLCANATPLQGGEQPP